MLVWKKKKVILGYDFVLEKREKGMKPKKLVCLFRDASGSWRTTSEALGTYWTFISYRVVNSSLFYYIIFLFHFKRACKK